MTRSENIERIALWVIIGLAAILIVVRLLGWCR